MQFVAMHLYCQAISFPDKALVEDNSSRKIKTDQNTVHIRKLKDNLYYVMVDIACADTTKIADIDVAVRCIVDDTLALHEIEKSFHWLPNLTSSPGQIVSQHVFRSPCIIHTLKNKSIILIPDLKLLTKNRAAPYYLSLQYTNNSIDMHYGISAYHVVPHQYYEKSNMSFLFAGKLQMGFYLLIPKTTSPLAVLRLTNSFLWRQVATKYTSSVLPQTVSFARYAKVGYDMALEHFWVDAGKGKGGITLSTHYDSATKEYRGRFFKNDLWYQSWFNNLRTAYGLYYWGGQLQNKDWKEKALQIVNLLMHAPDNGGWFPTLYNTEAGQWIASGTGPDYRYFYYVPDNAWTAYWLLRFNDERTGHQRCRSCIARIGQCAVERTKCRWKFSGICKYKNTYCRQLTKPQRLECYGHLVPRRAFIKKKNTLILNGKLSASRKTLS
jgi:hypothetical protein